MEMANLHSAKTHLSKLVERVYEGEEIIICKSGRPMAKLIKYATESKVRVPGGWQGRVRMSSDFDILPDSIKSKFKCDE
jgi:prevent-host-death family protein